MGPHCSSLRALTCSCGGCRLKGGVPHGAGTFLGWAGTDSSRCCRICQREGDYETDFQETQMCRLWEENVKLSEIAENTPPSLATHQTVSTEGGPSQ